MRILKTRASVFALLSLTGIGCQGPNEEIVQEQRSELKIPVASLEELNASIEIPKAESDAIRKHMHEIYFNETEAADFAQRHGARVVPMLIGMLSEDIPPKAKGHVSFQLGMFKDAEAVSAMIHLVESAIQDEMSDDTAFMIGFTLDGIGLSGLDVGIAFLEKLAGQSYWNDLASEPSILEAGRRPARSELEAVKEFRQGALRGIGLAGNQKCIAALLRLRQSGADDLVAIVDIWLEEARFRTGEIQRPESNEMH